MTYQAQTAKDHRPALSVLMSCFNAAPFLRECVDSILGQSFSEFELLLMDDGSTDDTYSILQSYDDPRMRIFRHEQNRGIVASVNELASRARADILVRHDADDVSAPTRLQLQHQFLALNPDVAVVGTAIEFVNAKGEHAGGWSPPTSDADIRSILPRAIPFSHATTAIQRSAYERIGGYREAFQSCEDYDFFLRIADHGRLANLDQTLYKVRRHGNNQTVEGGRKQLHFELLAKLSARARADTGMDIHLPERTEDVANFLRRNYPKELEAARPWLAEGLFYRAEQALVCGNYASAFRVFAQGCAIDFKRWRLRWFAGRFLNALRHSQRPQQSQAGH